MYVMKTNQLFLSAVGSVFYNTLMSTVAHVSL